MSRHEAIEHVKQVTGMVVQSGPFKGMKLARRQTWGGGEDIAPQLLGVYEQELHETLAKFRQRNYTKIINIGCAEGYYAVGLAMYLDVPQVYAFDVSEPACEVCRQNAVINGVSERLIIGGSFGPEKFAELLAPGERALLVVDCEGYEKTLFTSPLAASHLKCSDFIIETHDSIDRDITPSIMRSFAGTHQIGMVSSGGRNPNAFPFLARLSDADRWMLICENRPESQNWLIIEATNWIQKTI